MRSFKYAAGVAAIFLFVASCEKDPGELLVKTEGTDISAAYVINQGETIEIPVEVSNLAKGGLKVTATSSDELYQAVATKPDGAKFTIKVTSPEIIIKESAFKVGFTAVDTVYNRTLSAEYNVTSQFASNYVAIEDRANTYIVAPGSIVRFPASIGNSSANADFDAVSLIWQDAPGLVKQLIVDDSDIIAVLGEGISGNALVGASKDGKNVWDWNLWVSDYNPTDNLMTYSVTSNDVTTEYAMMDRNIGAMANDCSVASHGLLYQWGRIEPFSAKTMYDMEGNEIEYNVATTFETISELNVENLMDYAHCTPLTFYNGGASNYAGRYAWFTTSKDAIEGIVNGKLWNSAEKSAVDPCPAGYRIPSYAAFGFTSTFTKEKVYDGLNEEGTNPGYPNIMGWEYDNNGKKFYFPLQGDINQNGVYEMYYHPDNTAGGYRYIRLWITNLDMQNQRGFAMQANSNAGLSYINFYFNYGNAVRCIKE